MFVLMPNDPDLIIRDLSRGEFLSGDIAGYNNPNDVEYVAAEISNEDLYDLFSDVPNVCFVDRYQNLYNNFRGKSLVYQATDLPSLKAAMLQRGSSLFMLYNMSDVTELDRFFDNVNDPDYNYSAYVFEPHEIDDPTGNIMRTVRTMRIDNLLNENALN